MNKETMKPISLWKSLLVFRIPETLILLKTYLDVPILMKTASH